MLVAAAALLRALVPDVPRLVQLLADVAVYVEAKTNWSYDAVTDFVVVAVIAVLLVAERARSGLTRFFLTIVMLLPWVRGTPGLEIKVPSDPPNTRWVWTVVMTWGTSVAAAHVFD